MQRSTDPTNRRRNALTLTPAGKEMLAVLRNEGNAVEADLLAGLTGRERATLHTLLHKLLRTTTPG